MIRAEDLIALFRKMYEERWAYEWGAARKGVVDCSGAFSYAFRQLGGSIYHGSNTIARRYAGEMQKTPVPGYAAFRWKKADTAKYPDRKGDFYHIGLVDADGAHVLNAKGKKYGFSRDPADGWHCFAPLAGVEYGPSRSDGADSSPKGGAGNGELEDGLASPSGRGVGAADEEGFAVFLPCASEGEAKALAGSRGGAVLLRNRITEKGVNP